MERQQVLGPSPELLSAIMEADEDGDDFSQPFSQSFSHSDFSDENSTNKRNENRNGIAYGKRTDRTTLITAGLFLCMWIAAVGIFLYVGIDSEMKNVDDKFERRARKMVGDVSFAMVDFERYAKWIHQRCSRPGKNLTHETFKNLYSYILSEDAMFSLVGWLPNITHDERLEQEAFSREYFEERIGLPYHGFVTIDFPELDPNCPIPPKGSGPPPSPKTDGPAPAPGPLPPPPEGPAPPPTTSSGTQPPKNSRLLNTDGTSPTTNRAPKGPSPTPDGIDHPPLGITPPSSPSLTPPTQNGPPPPPSAAPPPADMSSAQPTCGPIPKPGRPRVADYPYYFPAHFLEPLETSLHLFDADMLRVEDRGLPYRLYVNRTLQTGKPVLSRFMEGRPYDPLEWRRYSNAYLFHPGVPVTSKTGDNSGIYEGIAMIQITIPQLLLMAGEHHEGDNIALYLYDISDNEEIPQFIGGLMINNTVNFFYKEVNNSHFYADVRDANSRRYEPVIEVAMRSWKIVVVPIGDFYQPDFVFIIVGGAMILVGSFFLAVWLYHNYQRGLRLEELKNKAQAENAIVASLFPAKIHDRLLEEQEAKQHADKARNAFENVDAFINSTNDFKSGESLSSLGSIHSSFRGDASMSVFGSKPIADLFPDATIMFADLVGFTAWSSVREPAQVFTLLETIYHSFDMIGKKLRIFKVETIGDCYVAVAGLPQPRKDHAVAMAKFAHMCLDEMQQLVKFLETTLGPDTGDLNLRVGLHSGEVTGGVIRGDKGRFQLFGDTMHTASRMESTGQPGRIQVSETTALLLKEAKKGRWLTPREELVVAKGNGELQTYWLQIMKRTSEASEPSSQSTDVSTTSQLDEVRDFRPAVTSTLRAKPKLSAMEEEKINRLIKWNVEVLAKLLKKVVARRMALNQDASAEKADRLQLNSKTSTIPLEEVQDIISLLEYKQEEKQVYAESITLPDDVMSQLHNYVSVVASLYQRNPFHNFEHASHVTMSVTKLLSRVTELQKHSLSNDREDVDTTWNHLHDCTYGIASDPMISFACAFSALIHDVDHPGVPNMVLMEENMLMAHKFKKKSVAEQNSIEIGWELLNRDEYQSLRECICGDKEGFEHFRQLVVNIVMATDVMDKDLGAERRARWDKAFSGEGGVQQDLRSLVQEDRNRKATLVIEHIIQASDVAHTMQHWHIYVKWNERLFQEMYDAYKAGRLTKDPSVSWYDGEKGFFDYYILPLAKKLDACGVFGASSHEYHNYAVRNRQEWEMKGEAMVEKYLKRHATFTKLHSGDDTVLATSRKELAPSLRPAATETNNRGKVSASQALLIDSSESSMISV